MNNRNLFAALFLLFAFAVSAQNKNFFEALDKLVKDCPQLQILKNTNEATIETERAINRITSPEVSVENVWGRNGVGNKFDLGINQSFDWPSLYRARAHAISAQTNANTLLEQATVMEKVQEIQSLMIDIIFQKKSITLDKMVHEHMIQMEEAAKLSLANGEISKLEFIRTQLEKIQTAIQLRENERILSELYSSLETASGKDNVMEILKDIEDVPDGFSIHSEEEYEAKMNRLDPRMAYLNAVIEAVNTTSKAERMAATLPSFNIGYVFQREQGETFNGFNISFTLPVYGSRHVRSAAKANIISAQLEAQLEQVSILSRIRHQRAAALSLARELNDYATIFDKDNYAELLKMALEGGQTDNIHYLQELNYYIEVTRQYIELQHQYNLALVSLNRYDLFE